MKLDQVSIMTPEHVPLTFRLAGLGSRATANLIDWSILALLYIALSYLLVSIMNLELFFYYSESLSSFFTAFIIFVLFFLWICYFVFFEYFADGKTPGKKLLGLRVIQDNGQSLTFLASTVRNLFRIVDFLPIFFFLGILMIFIRDRHQRIGDMAGGTLVIYHHSPSRKKRTLKLPPPKARPQALYSDETTRKKFRSQEWNLLKTYYERKPFINKDEREELTRKTAQILLPLAGVQNLNKPYEELEQDLLSLYGTLKDEWET